MHGPIASVWTPYDFWVDGKFSHCGIDIFDLVKTAEGWKISGLTYTVERTGCAPSPLGPSQVAPTRLGLPIAGRLRRPTRPADRRLPDRGRADRGRERRQQLLERVGADPVALFVPAFTAVGKWMPASTRDAPFSCAASENDQNRRVIPPYGAPLVIANVT